ncbi:MAG: pyruvate kinase [Planctomycetes bacterium]|nr:pyruvate kinase [Planctomycetota bacterium]
MSDRVALDRVRSALQGVEQLLRAALVGADQRAAAIARARGERRASAHNLACYLAARRCDLRPLQRELAGLSLSSLGRMEGHVLDTLHGLRRVLRALAGGDASIEDAGAAQALDMASAERLLDEHAVALLGAAPGAHRTRVMVTLPTAAAHDEGLVRDLIAAGTDLVRINLAHDGPAEWTAMARNVRAASVELQRQCRILADLPGPKLRTGELQDGPRVAKVRPRRDALGAVSEPAKVLFLDPGVDMPAVSEGRVVIPLSTSLARLGQPGDTIVVFDTRGRRREFAVEEQGSSWCVASLDRTAYLGSGCHVELRHDGARVLASHIGDLPPMPSFLSLDVGDLLTLTRSQEPGGPVDIDDETGAPVPARIPCTLPEAFDVARPGQRVLFDDGRIAGVLEAVEADRMLVRITVTPPRGGRLRAAKGINLPDTELRAPALTAEDGARLDWLSNNVDLVGMSFVQRPEDVRRLRDELQRRGAGHLGIVLKIETARAFAHLADLLFAGLAGGPFGVMVARGDLAVEVGYERMAEVQEEILWLCEAAHVPVIWATQVLDSMARTGMPSRAEVTDAAMGVRSECVMLNKGPHIVDTVRFLGDVLTRMQAHHDKKRSMMRRLHVADVAVGSGDTPAPVASAGA